VAKNSHTKAQKVDHSGSFIQLPRAILDSPAWHSLSMRARCLLLALSFRFKGQNNGHIPASSRDLATAIGSSRYPANRAALGELMMAGFVVAERMHPKGSRMATEYRLTWIESGHGPGRRPASNEWRNCESGNMRKHRGAETSTRNRKHADAPSTDRKFRVDAPLTGEVETPLLRIDAPSTPLVSHLSGAVVVPFPSIETFQIPAGQFPGAACMQLDELRSFTLAYLRWAGEGSQSRLAKSASVPGGSLSKFLAGRSLAAHHRMNLQLAVGRAWPVVEREGVIRALESPSARPVLERQSIARKDTRSC
jgi:hypothetical protein